MDQQEADPDIQIINNIRDPWKLLVLDLDIGMGVAPIVFIGFAAQHQIGALILGAIVAFQWQSFRNNNPKGAGLRWLWWHTPDFVWKVMKTVTPPSHRREFIG